jgi:hypothetical protein
VVDAILEIRRWTRVSLHVDGCADSGRGRNGGIHWAEADFVSKVILLFYGLLPLHTYVLNFCIFFFVILRKTAGNIDADANGFGTVYS